MNIKNLSDLKEAKYNPRVISDKALSGLKYSLEEFGDLSGITFNIQTGNLVTGHQRTKALKEKYGDLEIIHLYNDTGIIKTPDGNEHRVRFVNWDLDKEKAANIAANSETLQGEFTPEVQIIIQDIKLESPGLSDALLLDEINIPVSMNNELVEKVNNQDEWIGLPVYENGGEPFRLIVLFDTNEEREQFLELIKIKNNLHKNGKTLSIKWPYREKRDISSLRFDHTNET
jgi:hypothetical protein